MQETCTATVALEKQMESFPLHNIECARNGQFPERKLVWKLNRFSSFRCVRREIIEHCVYVEEMNARNRQTFRFKVPILQLLVVSFSKNTLLKQLWNECSKISGIFQGAIKLLLYMLFFFTQFDRNEECL